MTFDPLPAELGWIHRAPTTQAQPTGAGVAVRRATAEDAPFLWEVLALAVTAEPPWTVAQARAEPGVAVYLAGWPRAGDLGVVAVDDRDDAGPRLGAAWYRRFTSEAPGYGFVDEATPELTIGCVADARGRGIGRQLLDALLMGAHDDGVERLSLSVDPTNLVARRLYLDLGFAPDGSAKAEAEGSITLVATTVPGPPDRRSGLGSPRPDPGKSTRYGI